MGLKLERVRPSKTNPKKQRLAKMKTTDLFAIYHPRRGEECREDRLVVRLDGPPTFPGGETYIPVEDFRSGRRFEPHMGNLSLLTEMEALAWASR